MTTIELQMKTKHQKPNRVSQDLCVLIQTGKCVRPVNVSMLITHETASQCVNGKWRTSHALLLFEYSNLAIS